MDSIKPGVLKAIEREGARLVRAPREKDDTDLMLAARYAAEELKANEAVVFGGLGGRLDHTLGNLQVLAYLKNKGVDAFMVDESAIVQLMKGQGQIVADVGSTVSILPYQGNAVVTVTDGRLKYPLQALELRGDFPMGLSNVMETAKVSLKIEGQSWSLSIGNNSVKEACVLWNKWRWRYVLQKNSSGCAHWGRGVNPAALRAAPVLACASGGRADCCRRPAHKILAMRGEGRC